jgi:glyoxalase superfamily protein
MAIPFQVTFDCADPEALALFWAAALDYQQEPPPPGHDSWRSWAESVQLPEEQWNDFRAIVDPDGAGPRLFFQRVPEGKMAKNRVHLDVNVGGGRATPEPERAARVAEAVDRLVDLGAGKLREVRDESGHFVVMRDPEGNEFCLQ